MVALDGSFYTRLLTHAERADMQADLDTTRRTRTGLRTNIRDLREQGRLTVAWEDKLQSQVEACSRHILRYEQQLGDGDWFAMAAETALEHGDALKRGRA